METLEFQQLIFDGISVNKRLLPDSFTEGVK